MRFEIPDDKKLVHELVIPIRWGDMDALGHVNNTVYFRFMEIVRLDWLDQVRAGAAFDGQFGPLIVNAFCNFYQQLSYPGDLLARHYTRAPGTSSFETFVTLERTDSPGDIQAAGGAQMVWTDFSVGRSSPMPDWLRSLVTPPPRADTRQ